MGRYRENRDHDWFWNWIFPLSKNPKKERVTYEQLVSLLPDSKTLQTNQVVQLIDEVQSLLQARQDRIKTAETKATSLLGSTAIAASLATAGAALILDESKIPTRAGVSCLRLSLYVCLPAYFCVLGLPAELCFMNIRYSSRLRQTLSSELDLPMRRNRPDIVHVIF